MKRLLLIELNEINFEALQFYIDSGLLPAFKGLLDRHGYSQTVSERRYEDIEPWIQWVTAHTGLTLAEHGVFRLGDIVKKDIPQIWEELERKGVSVGAVSPMNAKNRTQQAAFFLPDPWTTTSITGPRILSSLHRALAQAVSDNSQGRIKAASALWLAVGLAKFMRTVNLGQYFRLATRVLSKPWTRAISLDLFLADVFIKLVQSRQPVFASLFLNAGAHIQHHYMLSSPVYRSHGRNPSWYLAPHEDPLLEVYRLYDRILGQLRSKFPDARLMIATGLHQEPHARVTYYWRLKDHARFLHDAGVRFVKVEPLMSRDFLIKCASKDEAVEAQKALESAEAKGEKLFEVDNRGEELFVMLVYAADIDSQFAYTMSGRTRHGLREQVAFVALKNGEHSGIGYFIDTGNVDPALNTSFPLTELPARIHHALFPDVGVPTS